MPVKPRSLIERFDEKVDRSAGPEACWPWMGCLRPDGYGVIRGLDRLHRAHRVALFRENDPGPSVIARHSCDNPPCCNPLHLLPGTQADNMFDMKSRGGRIYTRKEKPEGDKKQPAGRFSEATHCVYGHPFSPENTRMQRDDRVRSGFQRVCITCRKKINKELANRRKAERHKRGKLRRKKD